MLPRFTKGRCKIQNKIKQVCCVYNTNGETVLVGTVWNNGIWDKSFGESDEKLDGR